MQGLKQKIDCEALITASLKLIEYFKIIIVTGLITETFLNCFNIITAFDYPWQLAEGQFILNHGYSCKSVLQAYGEISSNFTNEYIIYEVVLAEINFFAGWLGTCVFFAIITFLIYIPCLLAFFRKKTYFSLASIFIFLIAQAIINWRLAARPELVADVCYIAVGISLLRNGLSRWNNVDTLYIGLIFCIWSNAHSSFLIGLLMIGLWYTQMLLSQWKTLFLERDVAWIKPGAAAFIGSAMNPFVVSRFTQPFELHGLLWGQGSSFEMWPMTLDLAWLPLVCTVTGLMVLLVQLPKNKCYWLIALLLLLQYLTFLTNRYSIFLGLTLLIILWSKLQNTKRTLEPKTCLLPLALTRVVLSFFIALVILGIIYDKVIYGNLFCNKCPNKFLYPNTLVATDSSFAYLRSHSKSNYFLLSHLSAGSWSQMPGYSGINPLFDSGTHRYSNQVNEFFYYTYFDPDRFKSNLSNLNINAVIIDDSTFFWALVLNKDTDWKLTQLASDSQLYLRENNNDKRTQQKGFLEWEQNETRDSSNVSIKQLLRGLNLRSDQKSIIMLENTDDISWMFDPQISYIQYWLRQVPDNLIESALNNSNKNLDNSSIGMHIIFALRLKQNALAKEMAKKWNPSILEKGYQQMQELRAEAFICGEDNKTACNILQSLWPQPRYSLRWAKLCQQAYENNPKSMPRNAQLLISLDAYSGWQKSLILLLNQNILDISHHSL